MNGAQSLTYTERYTDAHLIVQKQDNFRYERRQCTVVDEGVVGS